MNFIKNKMVSSMKLKYNENFIREVVNKSDILVIAISASKKFNRIKSLSNQRFYTNCIFHNDKHPSMILDRNKNTFECKSTNCQKYGDVIAFTMKLYNLDFVEAIQLLAYSFNIYLRQGDIANIDKDLVKKIKDVKKSSLYKQLIIQSEQKTEKFNNQLIKK